MTEPSPACLDAAACVDAVVAEGWRRDIRDRTGLWPLGVIAGRIHQHDRAEYAPFRSASAVGLAAVLQEQGVEPDAAELIVAAAWWALRLAGRDTTTSTVQRLAERAAAYRVGYLAGQLQPASV
jgi:hypothetical protein